MASQAKKTLALETLDVVAGKGYYSATEIKNCVDDKIHPIISPPIIPPIDTQQQQKKTGRYGKDDCVYCCTYTGRKTNTPALTIKHWQKKQPQAYSKAIGFIYSTVPQIARTALCVASAWQSKRLTEKYGGGSMEPLYNPIANLANRISKGIVKRRGAIVEHPLGTIKRSLGWDHYLVRGKESVF